jgi:hypothetical protein
MRAARRWNSCSRSTARAGADRAEKSTLVRSFDFHQLQSFDNNTRRRRQMYEEMMGTKPVSERQKFDVDALRAWLRRTCRTSRRPRWKSNSSRAASRTRPSSCAPGPQLRAAHQARPGREAAALGPRHRPRIPRDGRAAQGRLSRCRASIALCTDESVIGRAFFLMEFVEGRVLWDQSLPGMTPRGTRRHLRRTEPRDRPAAHGRLRRHRPGRLRQARQLLSRARSSAGPGSTRPPQTETIEAMDR